MAVRDGQVTVDVRVRGRNEASKPVDQAAEAVDRLTQRATAYQRVAQGVTTADRLRLELAEAMANGEQALAIQLQKHIELQKIKERQTRGDITAERAALEATIARTNAQRRLNELAAQAPAPASGPAAQGVTTVDRLRLELVQAQANGERELVVHLQRHIELQRIKERQARGEISADKAQLEVTIAQTEAQRRLNDLQAKGGSGADERGFLGLKKGLQETIGLATAGVAAVKTLTSSLSGLYAAAERGAKLTDQTATLRRQIDNFDELIAKTSEAAGGMARADIVQAASKFKSFGLDMNEFVRAAEQAHKTAVRLGEDSTHLFNSLVTGVARESRELIDNLGIIVRVEEATERYAASLGKKADMLTAAERKAALLNATLTALEAQNRDVVDGQTQSVKRLSVAWDEFMTDMDIGLGQLVSSIGNLGKSADPVHELTSKIQDLNRIKENAARIGREWTEVDEEILQGLYKQRDAAVEARKRWQEFLAPYVRMGEQHKRNTQALREAAQASNWYHMATRALSGGIDVLIERNKDLSRELSKQSLLIKYDLGQAWESLTKFLNKKWKPRRGGGRRMEQLDTADLIELDKARLKAQGELTDEVRKRIVLLDYERKVAEINKAVAGRRISQAKAEVQLELAQLEAKQATAEIDREAARRDAAAAKRAADAATRQNLENMREAERILADEEKAKAKAAADEKKRFEARVRAVEDLANVMREASARVSGYSAEISGAMNAAADAMVAFARATSTAGKVDAVLAGLQNIATATIKNERTLAAVLAPMEAGRAAAAFATGNIPSGILHSIASGYFGGVALGVISAPKGAAAKSAQAVGASRPVSRINEGGPAGNVTYNINVQGFAIGTEQQLAHRVAGAMQSARGTGMAASGAV